MRQRGRGASFQAESFEAARIVGELLRQNLDCDRPAQRTILRQVHVPHAAGTEAVDDVVV